MPRQPAIADSDPARAGVDSARVAALAALARRGVEQRLYPGAAFALVRRGGLVAVGAAGSLAENPDHPATPETVWDLASLTKPACTATSILILVERGAFHLRDEIGRFVPQVAHTLRGVALRHLLTHTSGLPPWLKLHSQGWSPEQAWERVYATGRRHRIGQRFVYSDLGYMLLGRVVERVAKASLEQFAQREIFEPLGMERTAFRPAGEYALAATHCPDRQRVLAGEVHDGNCHTVGGVAGHAGLFAPVADLARYAACLLNEGVMDGCRILGPPAVRAMATNQIDPAIGGMTYGWFTRPNGMLPAGDLLPADAFGHTGFTGTSLVISPSLDLAVILLTNRVYYERPAGDFLRFRRLFHNAAAACVTGP